MSAPAVEEKVTVAPVSCSNRSRTRPNASASAPCHTAVTSTRVPSQVGCRLRSGITTRRSTRPRGATRSSTTAIVGRPERTMTLDPTARSCGGARSRHSSTDEPENSGSTHDDHRPLDIGPEGAGRRLRRVHGARLEDLRPGRHRGPRARRRDGRLRDRPVHRDHGTVRLGQVDPPALHRRSRHAHLRIGLHRRHRPEHARRQPPDRAPARPGRLRVPGLQPGPHPHRRGERHPAARAGRPEGRSGLDRRGRPDGGARGSPRHRPSELSGGQQQRVAVARRWPASRRSSSPTSPRATSTRARGPMSCSSCGPRSTTSARPSSWSPTTQWPPPTPTGSCSSPTAGSSTRCWNPRPSGCSTA
jgi:hypothetical protein